MADKEMIKINDINYAIYKIGEWKNNYEINQIGFSREIPVSLSTLKHVKMSMEEIRSSKFDLGEKEVNGFVAIALELNPKVKEMDLDDVIALEEKEYEDILNELDDLELLNDDGTLPLDSEEYLIYKLEKEHHLTKSTPANEFTRQFYIDELKRIKDALN